MEKCDICGKEFKNLAGLNSHKKLAHKISPVKNEKINEKASEKIIKPDMVTESKELTEKIIKKEKEFVTVNENKEFVKPKTNIYKDLYPSDGEVMNEWL